MYAIAQWGREHEGLARTLGFPSEQTPCVATLHLVFKRMDKEAFEEVLSRWSQEVLGDREEAIALDGKSLRGIRGEELPGVHLVAAYGQRSGLVLAQKGGQEPRLKKGN